MATELKTPHFLSYDGTLSGDGQALVAFIESQFVEADRTNNLDLLNSLAGNITHYYVNVYKAKTMTREQWVKDYPHGAMGAWSAKLYTEAKLAESQAIVDTAQKTTTLEAELQKLKESVAETVAKLEGENAALRTELDSLKAPKKAPAAKKADVDAPAEGEPASEPEA